MISNKKYYALYTVSFIILILPIWIVSYPPLVDYPSHLARAYAISRLASDSLYQAQYHFHFSFIPNLGSDLVLPGLMHFFSMQTAGKIFLSLLILFFGLGSHFLGRQANGTVTWTSILATFVVFNSDFLWGFLNYIFGLSFFLFGLTLWLRWRRTWNIVKFAVFAGLLLACYIVHLSAVALLILSIISIELSPRILKQFPTRTPWIIAGGAILFCSAVLSFVRISLGTLPPIIWSSPTKKVILGLSPVLSYSRALDVTLIVMIATGTVLFIKRSLRLDFNSMLTIPAYAMALAFLLLPSQVGWIGAIDARMTPAFTVLFLLGLKNDAISLKWGKIGFTIILMAFAIRMFEITSAWRGMSNNIASQLERIDRVPVGATLFPVVYDDYCANHKLERPMLHVVSYSIHDRHALVGNSWPGLIDFNRTQPRFLFLLDSSLVKYNWRDLFSYDYLWAYHPKDDMLDTLQSHCELISFYDSAFLFRVLKSE